MGSPSDKGATGQMGMQGEAPLSKSQLINKLHKVNQMEIEVGNLAQTHAKSPKVKQFGETIVKDHTKADKELMDLAKAEGITLAESGMGATGGSKSKGESGSYKSGSSDEGSAAGDTGSQGYKSGQGTTTGQAGMGESDQMGMKESHQAKIDKLSSLQGDAFDRAFLTMMVEDHTKVINLLESEKGKLNDKKLDAFIDKQLPTLRDHLRTAERLQREVPAAS
jgi:putative membrane protein